MSERVVVTDKSVAQYDYFVSVFFVALSQLNLIILLHYLCDIIIKKIKCSLHCSCNILTGSFPLNKSSPVEARRRVFYIAKVGHGGNGTNSYSVYVYAYLREWYTID